MRLRDHIWPWRITKRDERRAAAEYERRRGWHLPLEERARLARERSVGAPIIHVHQPDHFDRTICANCDGMHYVCRCGQTEDPCC
jgi:hypothetical protein